MNFGVHRFHQFAQLRDALLWRVGVGLGHQFDIEVVRHRRGPRQTVAQFGEDIFAWRSSAVSLFGQMLAGHVMQ